MNQIKINLVVTNEKKVYRRTTVFIDRTGDSRTRIVFIRKENERTRVSVFV